MKETKSYWPEGKKVKLWEFWPYLFFALLGIWGLYITRATNEDNKFWIENPKIGDVYVYEVPVDDGDGIGYSGMKVADVRSDSLLIQYNEFVSRRRGKMDSGIIDFKKDYAYDKGVWVSREKINHMFEVKTIIQVYRNDKPERERFN